MTALAREHADGTVRAVETEERELLAALDAVLLAHEGLAGCNVVHETRSAGNAEFAVCIAADLFREVGTDLESEELIDRDEEHGAARLRPGAVAVNGQIERRERIAHLGVDPARVRALLRVDAGRHQVFVDRRALAARILGQVFKEGLGSGVRDVVVDHEKIVDQERLLIALQFVGRLVGLLELRRVVNGAQCGHAEEGLAVLASGSALAFGLAARAPDQFVTVHVVHRLVEAGRGGGLQLDAGRHRLRLLGNVGDERHDAAHACGRDHIEVVRREKRREVFYRNAGLEERFISEVRGTRP